MPRTICFSVELFALLVNIEFGITDNVDEQDVTDLEFQFGERFGHRRLFRVLGRL